jgi:hypothetical protein
MELRAVIDLLDGELHELNMHLAPLLEQAPIMHREVKQQFSRYYLPLFRARSIAAFGHKLHVLPCRSE